MDNVAPRVHPTHRRASSGGWKPYAVAAVVEIALTVVLILLKSTFPLHLFPTLQIITIMVIAYFYGIGPASFAFSIALMGFVYFFAYPTAVPRTQSIFLENWAGLASLLLGSVIGGFAALMFRQSQMRARKLADELEEQRALLSALMNSVPVGLGYLSTDLRYRLVNQTLANMSEMPAQDIIGKSFREVIPEGARADAESVYRKAIDTGEPSSWHNYSVIINGKEHFMDVDSVPVKSASGEIIGLTLTLVDTTEQANAHKELERQKALLETFTQNVPVGLAFIDTDFRHVVANMELEKISRVPRGETVGKLVSDVLPSDFATDVEKAVRYVMDTSESVVWHEVSSAMVGGNRYIDASFLPVKASDGSVLGVGVVLVDMTEQVRMRKDVERNYEREHHIAEVLQTALLGDIPNRTDSLLFETVYHAALEESRVGGDFYDAFLLPSGKVALVIGDVSGKGLNAAVQVALAKYSLRGRTHECESPSKLLEHVNSAMVASTDLEGFVTLFVGVWDCDNRRLIYANGGHAPVLLWKHDERRSEIVPSTGPLVGVVKDAKYQEKEIDLCAGDELLLGTDGLFEVRCGARMLDIDDLLELYDDFKRSGRETAEEFINVVSNLCNAQFRDDIAVLRVLIAEQSEQG